MRPVVFLDFDDVLATHRVHNGWRVFDAFSLGSLDAFPELWRNVFDTVACRNLQTLHAEFEPSYVISSSWASHLSRDETDEVLKRTELHFVERNLHEHWRTPRDGTSGRLTEIEEWLKLHAAADGPAYVIIDDHISGGALSRSWLAERTVLCDGWVGFTYAKLRTARKILRAQNCSTCNTMGHRSSLNGGSNV